MQRAYIVLLAKTIQSDLRPRNLETQKRLRLIQIYVKI
jgi:hypothetical protein